MKNRCRDCTFDRACYHFSLEDSFIEMEKAEENCPDFDPKSTPLKILAKRFKDLEENQ